MINQLPLFYNPLQHSYYYVGPVDCEACGEQQDKTIIIKAFWDKKNSKIETLCLHCFNKNKERSHICEIRGARITDEIPENCVPLLMRPPPLSDGDCGETIFSAVEKPSVSTKDNTKHAGRESWSGSQIGISPNQVDDKRNILNYEELNKKLIDFKNDSGFKKKIKKKSR